jgi:shikimate kinase
MNITLIGMPGVGKSFIGRSLAERLNCRFIDIDEIIEGKAGKKLQKIIDEDSEKRLLELEEKTILDLGRIGDTVISPGGSVVYSKKAMEYLKNNTFIILLNDSLENIKKRINNLENRGMIGLKGRSFEELFEERWGLYIKYADLTINIDGLDINAIIDEIVQQIKLIL